MLLLAVAPSYGQNTNTDPDKEIQEWVNTNFGKVLDLIMPIGLAASDETVKDAPEWVVAVRVFPAWDMSEFYQLSFSKKFKEKVEATLIISNGASISEQLVSLRKKYPRQSLEEISKLVSVNRHTFTEKERPQLRRLAHEFENLKMSPLPPNAFILHGTDYRTWLKPYWVNHVEYKITEPSGSYWGNLGKYPHPLSKWIENVRMVLLNNARSRPSKPLNQTR